MAWHMTTIHLSPNKQLLFILVSKITFFPMATKMVAAWSTARESYLQCHSDNFSYLHHVKCTTTNSTPNIKYFLSLLKTKHCYNFLEKIKTEREK